MERCANTESLNAYMNEIDKQELIYEAYQEELNQLIGNLVDDILILHEIVANKYPSIDEDIHTYIKER